MPGAFFPSPELLATLPSPNYVNPETRGAYTITTAIVCAVLSNIAVALRLVAKLKLKKGGLTWDDFWILFGLIFSNLFFADLILAVKVWGWNHHIYDIAPHLRAPAAAVDMSGLVLFILSGSATRTSLLCFYLNLIRDASSTRWRYAVYGTFILTAIGTLSFSLAATLRCRPFHAFWALHIPKDAYCFDNTPPAMLGGCLVITADIFALLLPLPVIFRINMPVRARITAAVVLSLGLIVVFVSSVRMYYLWKALETYDTTWASHPLWTCSSVEILITIICACLPPIKPLYARLCSWAFSNNKVFKSFGNSDSSQGRTASDPPIVCVRPGKDMYPLTSYMSYAENLDTIEEIDETDADRSSRPSVKGQSSQATLSWLLGRRPSGIICSIAEEGSAGADLELQSTENSGSSDIADVEEAQNQVR